MNPAPASGKQAAFTERRRQYWDQAADSLDREPSVRGYYRRCLEETSGFREATGDLLMILDADLTVRPEDLTRFYEAGLTAGCCCAWCSWP